MKRFLEEYTATLKPKTAKRYQVSSNKLEPYFKDVYLDEIGSAIISEYQEKRRKGGTSPTTINRDINCLSSMLSCCADWQYIETNPILTMRKKKLKEKSARIRHLSQDEYERLLKELPEPIRAMVIVSVETLVRQEELFSMEWSQVNFERKELILTKTKTDSPRVIPLTDIAIDQLKAQKKHNSPYVFNSKNGTRYKSTRSTYLSAIKRAKIKDLNWHDLRKTGACPTSEGWS